MMRTYFERELAFLLALILALPLGELSSLAGTVAPADTSAVKQRVSDLGVGADVKLVLSSERHLRGTIQAIEDDAFTLLPEHSPSPQRTPYDQVSSIELAKLSYSTSGQPDPVEVRRLVRVLGERKMVSASLASGQRLTGRIQDIGQNDFVLSRGGQQEPVRIPYGEVRQLKGKLGGGEKALAIGAAAGVVLLVLVLIGRTQTD
jgi:ribosome maturation factor RimP